MYTYTYMYMYIVYIHVYTVVSTYADEPEESQTRGKNAAGRKRKRKTCMYAAVYTLSTHVNKLSMLFCVHVCAASFTLWQSHYQRSARDLNELDICLTIYDSAMRDAM